MGFTELLTIVFVVLKLIGTIDWSWWWVLLPEIIAITFYLSVFVITVLSVRSERRSFRRLYEKERKRMNRY